MKKTPLHLLLCLALLAALSLSVSAERVSPAQLRDAVNRSLPLLQSSLKEYPNHAACFSCHHQGVGMFTLALAAKKGFKLETGMLDAVVKHTESDLRSDIALYQANKGQPGGVTRAGYALFALQSGKVSKDTVTDAVSGFLLDKDKTLGYWNAGSNRPPAEVSPFTNNFLAIRALKTYGGDANKEAIAKRIDSARQWLEQAPTKETEDRVFQLWALYEAGASKEVLNRCAEALIKEQKEDGGWAQLPNTASDAYATGTALVALAMAGVAAPGDVAYQKGVQYLLNTQLPDGSWRVTTRSHPVQPYFESGFPHGKDQFISVAATGWAASALILAAPPR